MAIRELPPNLVNRIAAGEVVERPASVVKELIENAIDAGASRIDILATAGGLGVIRVTDDGVGMDASDLALSVERHATSKLADDDLSHILTLGFRGEALPSIGAVARLAIQSRARGAAQAYEVAVDGGSKIGVEAGGARRRHARRGARSLLRHAGAAEIHEIGARRERGNSRHGEAACSRQARDRLQPRQWRAHHAQA